MGSEEVRKKGRLVESKGGAFASFHASEQLGKRRRLLFLGAELSGGVTKEDAVQLQTELLREPGGPGKAEGSYG